jgi:hypothetical protein
LWGAGIHQSTDDYLKQRANLQAELQAAVDGSGPANRGLAKPSLRRRKENQRNG